MSKVMRVDLETLTSNEELLNNDYEDNRFSIDKYVEGNEKIEIGIDVPQAINSVPTEYDIFDDGFRFNDELTLEDDFNVSRKVTEMQIKMLTMAMQVAYVQFEKTGDLVFYDKMMEASYAIDSTKKAILNAHKDKAKVEKDKVGVTSTPNITATGTVNIQHNSYVGTTADILKQHGDALEHQEFVKE